MTTLIHAFNSIRKIPYKIVNIEYSLENSTELVRSQGASCTPKHIVLDTIVKSLGYQTRFCVHEFKWSSLNISLPEYLSKLINPTYSDFHTNIEVKIDTEWIRMDATWDDSLLDAGFIGTKNWDGKTSTLNCVTSINEYKFDTLEERNTFIQTKNTLMDNQDEFILRLNEFLERIRTQSK